MNKSVEKVTKAEYLDFFRNVLADLEEDFPNRFLELVKLQGPEGLEGILNSDNLTRWACVEAWMYSFTREPNYLVRARDLLLIIVEMIENTPEILWRYVHPKDPSTTEAIAQAYAAFPGSGWHIGGFSNHIGFGDCSLIMNRAGGWHSDQEKERVKSAAAAIADYRLEATGFFHFDDGQRNNRTLTSARGVYRVAKAFSDHPNAERWRDWAIKQFSENLNQPSDEDATGYQSDWFHSILNIIEYLELGSNQYYTPCHKSYFEHFRDLILPGGYCAAYGDSTGTNSAHLPILEKGATVFGDGTYKYAAANLFRRLKEREPDNAILQLGSLRWIDAYRWADDSIEPEFPAMKSTVTSEGTLFLRTGTEEEHSQISLTSNDQTSKTGSGHGHVDANAINCWANNGVALIEDGAYQWKDAIFHNRVLWRAGKPNGKTTDYFRPLKTQQHWDLKDRSKMVYSTHGPTEGVPEGWHPDEAVDTRTEILMQHQYFTAVRSTLGAHERTILLDNAGRGIVFDSIATDTPVTAICLYHARTILRQSENWMQIQSSDESKDHSGVIVNLEPTVLEIEPEIRNGGEENLIFSATQGQQNWFLTVLLPMSAQRDPADDVTKITTDQVGDEHDDNTARLLHLPITDGLLSVGCRRGGGGGESIEYNHGIRTDAKLLVASKQPDGLLTIDALQATVVEQLGKTIAASIEPENFHLAIEK